MTSDDEMTRDAMEANARLTAALQSLILAAHGTRVPADHAFATAIGRVNAWADKIESMAEDIEVETLYIREGSR